MISVCIPTFNGEKFIKEQLESILIQLNEDDEVIISDDSSSDKTIDIIRSFADKRIILIENCKFKSPIFNLENALKLANGDFIFLSDQDDIWMKDRVAKTIDTLKSFDIVVCDGYIVDSDLNVIHESYFHWKGSGPGFLKNLKKNSYLGCSLAFNRKILNAIQPFPKFIAMHDIWIGLLSEVIGTPFFLHEKLFCYRRHSDNFTASIQKSDEKLSNFSFAYKVWYRVLMVYFIVIRYFRLKLYK